MYQAKSLKIKHLEVKVRLKVQKHSLKAQGSEHQWLESQEKKRKMSLMKSSNQMLVVLMYQVVILEDKAFRVVVLLSTHGAKHPKGEANKKIKNLFQGRNIRERFHKLS